MNIYNKLFEMVNDESSYSDGSIDFINDINLGMICMSDLTDDILKNIIPHVTDIEVKEKMKEYLDRVPKKIIEVEQFTAEWFTVVNMLLVYLNETHNSEII